MGGPSGRVSDNVWEMPGDRLALSIVWRGRFVVAAAVAAGLVISLLVSLLAPKEYEARAIVQATPETDSALASQLVGQELAKVYARLVDDESFLERIAPREGRGSLANDVDASAVVDTSLVEISARASRPVAAVELATDVVAALGEALAASEQERRSAQRERLEQSIAGLDAQIDAAGVTSESEAAAIQPLLDARVQLVAELARLAGRDGDAAAAISLAAPPVASSAPIRPRTGLNLASGLLIGILVGLLLAWLRARLDAKVRSPRDVERILDVPVLAVVPAGSGHRNGNGDRARNAFDLLHTNLGFLARDHALSSVVFTGASPNAGTTSVVAGLAESAIRNRGSVALLDGDLRDRELSMRLAPQGAPGLADVVAGTRTTAEVAVSVGPGVSFLPAGRPGTSVTGVLASPVVPEVISELGASRALVVVDSPPVADLADASILAALAGGVVAIARAGATEVDDVAALSATLKHGQAFLVGAVVVDGGSRWQRLRCAAGVGRRRTEAHNSHAVP